MYKNMIKISIYILLIFTLYGCAAFKGTDDGHTIDQKGNVVNSEGKVETVEEIYSLARTSLKNEQYDIAIENYRKIEANFPFSKFASKSHIELAYAEYKLKHWDVSIAIIDRFISMNNTSEFLPYAYYLRGLINFNRGKTIFNVLLPHVQIDKDPINLRNSYEDFNYVYKNFKQSEYIKDSLKRMEYLRNTLASYEIHVANFYYKRKAYLAVINRCNYLIQKYPNSPANRDALIFLKSSYEKLLMKDNARDVEKIILANYPDYKSKYFEEASNNSIKQNASAASEAADNIAINLGFDIEEQKEDDFTGVYNVEYFKNDNLVDIPLNVKPEKYTIKHIRKNKDQIKKEPLNLLDYFTSDDDSDIKVKDVIVDNKKNENKIEIIKEKNDNSTDEQETESKNSENEILELIVN